MYNIIGGFMKEIIELLTKRKETVSTMESCTGGGIANAITNIEGASEVFKYSAVTYANEFKIKMGISKEVIDKYTVYSVEVANEMSREITTYAESDYGIGITGKLNIRDKFNPYGKDNIVFISIYSKKEDKCYNATVECNSNSIIENKALVLNTVIYLLKMVIERNI